MANQADAAALDAIYAAIPPVSGCRKGCSDCCGAVPMGRIEADRVQHVRRPPNGHPALPASAQSSMSSTPRKLCGGCGYATAQGCAIYDQRPFVCRLFGAVDGVPDMTCPHGAKAIDPLTADQADALSMRYMSLLDRRGESA